MFESSKPFVVALVAAALATGVAACGDDDQQDGSAQSAATATDTAAAQTDTAPAPAPDEKRKKAQQDADDAQGSGAADSGSGDSSSGSAPSGKVLGDGSIQRFGDSAGGEDRDEAVAAAQEFYAARGGSDWNRVCELLAGPIADQLKQMLAQAPQMKGKGCPELLAAMIGRVPEEARRREAAGLEFGELRIDGDSAFLIFKSTAIPNGFLPMAREDGEWKVAAIAGSSLQ